VVGREGGLFTIEIAGVGGEVEEERCLKGI
jgi:hypothetical protein